MLKNNNIIDRCKKKQYLQFQYDKNFRFMIKLYSSNCNSWHVYLPFNKLSRVLKVLGKMTFKIIVGEGKQNVSSPYSSVCRA